MGYKRKDSRPSLSIKEARRYFYIVMRHFGHDANAQLAAWQTYLAHPRRGFRCYKAIANSLGHE